MQEIAVQAMPADCQMIKAVTVDWETYVCRRTASVARTTAALATRGVTTAIAIPT
jgi:hypothetical protein